MVNEEINAWEWQREKSVILVCFDLKELQLADQLFFSHP